MSVWSDDSPLQEIERRVQLRAKEVSLDMAGDDGRAKLRSLIADEVAAWSDGYKRGLRAYDLSDPEVVAERAYRNLAGYGPLEPLLADDDVWEIMVNAPDGAFRGSLESTDLPVVARRYLVGGGIV